jgi:putative FmdB family regulatory protein
MELRRRIDRTYYVIIVDYDCPSCGRRTERVVPTPPPASVACRSCGTAMRRIISAASLIGRAAAPVPRRRRASPPPCDTNPDIPGLCFVDPAYAPMVIARARGDNRSLDRELERQERALSENPDGLPDPFGGHSESSALAGGASATQ